MLADLRQALADTIKDGMPEARVLAAPPVSLANLFPPSGVLIYLRPAAEYVSPWMTFSTAGRGVVNLDVVVNCVPSDGDSAEPTWRALDDAVDPISTSGSVFAAILDNPTLGVTAFECQAQPELSGVQGGDVFVDADGNQVRYEVVVPVQITVKRS